MILTGNRQSEKRPSSFGRESITARRQRIDAILVSIRHNRPHWAALPPWRAENYLESTAGLRQLELFARGGEVAR
jgi:hypothetical protein